MPEDVEAEVDKHQNVRCNKHKDVKRKPKKRDKDNINNRLLLGSPAPTIRQVNLNTKTNPKGKGKGAHVDLPTQSTTMLEVPAGSTTTTQFLLPESTSSMTASQLVGTITTPMGMGQSA